METLVTAAVSVAGTLVVGLVVGLVTWNLQRKSEHEKWIREGRRVAYAAFLSAASRYMRDATSSDGPSETTTPVSPLRRTSTKPARR